MGAKETDHPIVKVIEQLVELAGTGMNAPAHEFKSFDLPKHAIQQVAYRFGVPIERFIERSQLDDGPARYRAIYRAQADRVMGRRLSIDLQHEQPATQEDVEAVYRTQLNALGVHRAG